MKNFINGIKEVIKIQRKILGILVISLITVGSLGILFWSSKQENTNQNQSPQLSEITTPYSYTIVDTGQNKCYNNTSEIPCPDAGEPFYGQDAQYKGYQPKYVDNGDGTVTDLNTGLMWTKSPDWNGDDVINSEDKMTYQEALEFVEKLNKKNYLGYNDWRLPSIKELYSLYNASGVDPSGYIGADASRLTPFIDTHYFDFAYGDTIAGERIIDAQFVSSTKYVGGELVFGVNFADGRIKGYGLKMPDGREKTFYVLYVRENPDYGKNKFVDNGDGTITDLATGLMWTKYDSGFGMTWEEALAWVQQKNKENYLGYNDWRLPNAKELQSIVDYTRSPDTTNSPAIDPIFNCTQIINEAGEVDYPYYWTSTTHVNMMEGHEGAWAIYIAFGRGLGYMNGQWIDVHGAGCQRSDPKTGDLSQYSSGHGPQGDAVRIYNYVRLVRTVSENTSKVTVHNYVLTATGQTKAYDINGEEITGLKPGDSLYGQDGHYQAGQPMRYRDNGDGTITDLVTGLMWQKTPPAKGFTWEEAKEYVENLTLGGYNDWRLPTPKELFSIMNFSSGWPYVDTNYFDLVGSMITKDQQYWTNTKYVGVTVEGGDNAVFGVNEATGHIKAYPANPSGPIGRKYVRAVRGDIYGVNKFVDNGDGTITDLATGLMWTKVDFGPFDWPAALQFAENSTYAGYNDWRLPNVKELQSIVNYSYSPSATDPSKRGPAIDPIFNCTQIINEAGEVDYPYYWSSTSARMNAGDPFYYAWYVAFGRAVNPQGYDLHGAGAVRFDTKVEGGPAGEGGERIYNYIRLVRYITADSKFPQKLDNSTASSSEETDNGDSDKIDPIELDRGKTHHLFDWWNVNRSYNSEVTGKDTLEWLRLLICHSSMMSEEAFSIKLTHPLPLFYRFSEILSRAK